MRRKIFQSHMKSSREALFAMFFLLSHLLSQLPLSLALSYASSVHVGEEDGRRFFHPLLFLSLSLDGNKFFSPEWKFSLIFPLSAVNFLFFVFSSLLSPFLSCMCVRGRRRFRPLLSLPKLSLHVFQSFQVFTLSLT